MRGLAAILGLLALPATADPLADWIADQPERYRGFLTSVSETPSWMARTDACPADVFPRRGNSASGNRDCAGTPGWCLFLCKAGDRKACFGAARVIETEIDRPGEANLKFPLFMAACAAGNANGCTNAGATAKNGRWVGEAPPELAASRACQFRTYRATCDAGNDWGCFMLGLEWGVEGVDGATDRARAEQAWQKACDLKPDGSACAASRRRMD